MKFRPRGSFLNLVGLIAAWLLIFGFFSWRVPGSFPTLINLQTLARQGTLDAAAALGATFIIISAGIDLSVGSLIAFVSVAIAIGLRMGYSPGVAVIAGFVLGPAWGLVNGLLITKLRVGPFIITLGTMLAIRGAAKGIASEQSVYPPHSTWMNTMLEAVPKSRSWEILPWGVWAVLVCAILMSVVLRYTRFGRHVVAIGSNEHAARLCGVPVDRVKILVYVLGGLFGAAAGMCQFSRLEMGDPTSAFGEELNIIAAVVIGGASLSGGQGSIAGSLLGVLIMVTIASGATQMGLPDWVQQVVTGAIIVLAVALDQVRLRATKSA